MLALEVILKARQLAMEKGHILKEQLVDASLWEPHNTWRMACLGCGLRIFLYRDGTINGLEQTQRCPQAVPVPKSSTASKSAPPPALQQKISLAQLRGETWRQRRR